jgi:leucyl aminopeptidase
MWLPFLKAPGADDDGSGTITILEVFRSLVNTGFRPLRPVEFHWYSGEEAGLLGSQDIAQKYAKRGVDVFAMIQVLFYLLLVTRSNVAIANPRRRLTQSLHNRMT